MEYNTLPQVLYNKQLRAVVPSMRWDGRSSFAEWQKAAREKLISLLGLDMYVPAEDDCFTILSETEFDTFTDYEIRFQSEEGYFCIANLWVPKGKEGKLPLVVCLQGHSKGRHISLGRPKFPGDEETIAGGDRDFAIQIVREGYCALAIEQRNFGECGGTPEGYECRIPSSTALLYGRTTIGGRVFDISRALDLVTEHFSFVDADRIACMGNSGGGTATIYASAIDERIKVSMPSCALCTYKDSIGAMSHCACNYVPGIANYFDMGDLCGLIAPRKLIVVSGAKDNGFPHVGVEECVKVAGTYYEGNGIGDRYTWIEGPEGHRFYADLSWPVFHTFFD